MVRHDLRANLPRAGLIFAGGVRITDRGRYDEKIRNAMIPIYLNDDRRKVRQRYDIMLERAFQFAARPEFIDLLVARSPFEECGNEKYLETLRSRIPWASRVPLTAFKQFFSRMIEARRAWRLNPRYPYEESQQSRVARAIDHFIETAGNKWDDASYESEVKDKFVRELEGAMGGMEAPAVDVTAAALRPREGRSRAADDNNNSNDDKENASPSVHRSPPEKPQLLEWKDISPWRQEGSEHLQTGYRVESADVRACLRSWCHVHNDTVNILSHAAGAVVFAALPFWLFGVESSPRYHVATAADVVVCGTWFFGAAACFMLSTLFHTFMCHSERWYLIGIRLDHQGVLLLMWAATVPLVFYNFPPPHPSSSFSYSPAITDNNTNATSITTTTAPTTPAAAAAAAAAAIRTAHWTATAVLASACALATLLGPAVAGPRLRAALFAAFGAGSFLAPIAHGALIVVNGDGGGGGGGVGGGDLALLSRRTGLPWVGATAALNLVGVVVYALKVPEQWYPRRFDICGASHQIMHVMVFLAALAYTKAVLCGFDHLHQEELKAMAS
ncbi:hemolysin-III related-domain-containing protein [Xylariaceae sp. FL0804]|nr:hemolysin-III related-domain-containing protein [Xylariaceae sp. FL0804]